MGGPDLIPKPRLGYNRGTDTGSRDLIERTYEVGISTMKRITSSSALYTAQVIISSVRSTRYDSMSPLQDGFLFEESSSVVR